MNSPLSGQHAPSNRILMGCIGVGRMGQNDMKELIYRGLEANVRVVAVCDVDSDRARDARDLVRRIYREELQQDDWDCKIYGDFRELLARRDIDGVTIVTPDPWHAPIAVAAANAGKDIYIEKPLTYSIAEGRRLVNAVKHNNVVLQTGSQQRSSIRFRKTCELVRNGRIGRLHTIEVGLPKDSGTGNPVLMPVPANLNYQLWLGPTPDAPYTEDRVHPKDSYKRPGWLQIEQYCLGMITGWGAHMFDIAQWGVGADTDSGPVEVQATAQFPDRGLFDVHTDFRGEAVYANGVRLLSSSEWRAGVKFIGDAGWIHVWRGGWQAEPESVLRERIGQGEIHLYESKNHMANFLECMRTREDPIAPVEVGHRSNTVCVIHHIAMKLGRKLRWDPKAERFVDDPQANAMLDYARRKPWVVWQPVGLNIET